MKMLRFGGPNLPRGSHTWFEDFRGAIVRAEPGRLFPRAEIQDPDYYIEKGMAVDEGAEDGSTGKTQALLDDLRAVALRHGLITGDPTTFSLDEIVNAARKVKSDDDRAIAAFEVLRQGGPIEEAPVEQPVSEEPLQ
jgi:hypothetical protein